MSITKITLQPKDDAPLIPREIYSQFAEHLGRCIYEGVWVGEDSPIPNTRGIRNDVVTALKNIKVPVIRWPGGCFADEYHWMDGIGPREERPSMYNSHWGGVVENNHFGTHEFLDLCEQVGAEPYVCGNVGSGTVKEMSDWVEYMTSPAQSPMANLRRKNGREEPWKLTYFGVGNESWGCGGNMRPEFYADLYRQYNTFVRTYGPNKITRFACGANVADYNWTTVLMERAHTHMDGLSLHNYTILNQKWPPSGSATEFGTHEYYSILRAAINTERLVERHSAIMDIKDPGKRINLVVDEWGTWYPVEPGTNPGFLYQQNTVRDALVASVHLDGFHRHCERVRMTNIAQMINVLQAMILTKGEQILLTPTYWVFEMYVPHQDAKRIDLQLETGEADTGIPAVSATASQKDGKITVSASNLDIAQPQTIEISGLPTSAKVVRARILAGPTVQSHNTFEAPETVQPVAFDVTASEGRISLELPPASIVSIELAG